MSEKDRPREGRVHDMAKSAYEAAMSELAKADDLGIMLAATAKCGAWLLGEYSSAVVLLDDEMSRRKLVVKKEES